MIGALAMAAAQEDVRRELAAEKAALLSAIRPLLAADAEVAAYFDAMEDENETVSITIPVRCIRRAMDAYEKATGSRFILPTAEASA